MDLLFVKALNMSISASWLVLAVMVLRLLLKKAPRWIHVALWALVAVRLVCPVSLESVFSLIPSTQTVPEEIFYLEPPLDNQNTTLEILQPRPNGEAVDVELDTTVSVVQTKSVSWVFIWPAGMAVMVLYALISYLRLKRKVSASIDVGNGVYICDYIDTPFILGIVKPKIYLPSAMEPASASHVLAHERAHIARKDHWWKPLGYMILTIYWFNPVLWLAYILLCRDIELACDEKVIRDMAVQEKKAYSEALLSCSVSRRSIAACPLAFGEVGVKERVKTVLNYRKPAFWIVLVAVLALIVTAVCFLTDPVQWTEDKIALWFEEYAFEKVSGRMDREEVRCIAVQDDFALIYCQGEGPSLILYQFEQDGSKINILGTCTGEYTLSGGMSLNHVESGERHIYFGTISEYHYNPIVDLNTWLNWDYLSITDEKGKDRKQDMTGKDGFLFVLDAPMADFQAVDGLETVVLNAQKFREQGYAVKECWIIAPSSNESPFGKYYRVTETEYSDYGSESYVNLNTSHLFLLTEGKNLLSMDSAERNELYNLARFAECELTPEAFDALLLRDSDLGRNLREHNLCAWEYQEQRVFSANYHDISYLLQQQDGTLYLILGQIWDAQYREGESRICHVYRLRPIESADPFAESISPYQWTLNLRSANIQLMQVTVYDEEGVPHHTVLCESENTRLRQALNAVTEDHITLGNLKYDHMVSCYVQCTDENGWNADLDVNLQYDGSAVRMVFTAAGAERYPEERNKEWIIRSNALNEFLSVYTHKQPEQDPFSDPDNAYNWCKNIRRSYLSEEYILEKDSTKINMGHISDQQISELLRILNQLPEEAFEKAVYMEEYDISVNLFCRNVLNTDTLDPMVDLKLLDGEVYFTLGVDWRKPYQTWKINSHALADYIQELFESDWTLWQEIPVSGGVGLGNDAHKFVKWDMEGLEMWIPELDCFEYRVDEDGIRFKPEHVEGWILVQYRTEPFAVCGTGLEKSDVTYKNGKYAGVQGWYDGNKAWSFIDLTATDGEITHNVVFLNEETSPWVTEYFYEIVEVIHELSFLTTG